MNAPSRETLPARRGHELVAFEHAGHRYAAGIGRFADGRIAEVFLAANKCGTAIETQARDGAILLSLALQHGVPLATVRRALTRNADGSAAGPIGALLDLVLGAEGTQGCSAEPSPTG